MIKAFKEEDFFKLIEAINKFEEKEKVFATNIFSPAKDIFWYACAFYKSEIPKGEENQITENQINFIKKHDTRLREIGFDIDNIQTKQEAFKIISEFIKQNPREDGRKSTTNKN